MLRLGRAMGQAMRAHRPSLPGFSRAKSATPTATAAGSNINRTIDLLKTRLEEQGISVVTTGARVKAKSRDYYWFSPVLRGRLADKAADAFIAPENEAEVVEVLRACHELGVPVTVRGAGTGNYGQAVPLHGGVVLDVTRLTSCSFHNGSPSTGIVHAGAGAIMGTVEKELLRPAGWEFRMHPSTLSSATVGGFICGGSGGVGSVNYGVLKDAGNILSLRVVTMEAEPQVLDLDPLDSAAVSHAYGTNGVVTQVSLPLAPALDWHEALLGFPTLECAASFGLSLAEAPGIVAKQVAVLASPIPELYLEKRLARPGSRHQRVEPGSLATHGAVVVVTVAGAHAVSSMRDLAETSVHQGSVLWAEAVAEAEKHRRQPLYETCWNHTTLHAMRYAREGEEITYLQTGFAPGDDFLASISDVHSHFSKVPAQGGGAAVENELMTHLEFANLAGRIGAFGIPLVRFTTEERLREVVHDLETKFGLGVFNPHTYVLEDGGMKQTDQQQLDFKRKVDPLGLMNPGKMRAFEEGRANYDGTAGFDRIRVGSAAKHAAATDGSAEAVAAVMGDDVFAIPMHEVAQLTDDMMAVLRKGEEDDDDDDNDHEFDGSAVGPTGVVRDGSAAQISDHGSFTDRGCRYPFANNNWSDLTTVDFSKRATDPARAAASVAVLPVGAIEQHGPHLPVGVDTIHAHAVVTGALAQLPQHVASAVDGGKDVEVGDIRVLPTQAIGTSHEHLQYEGTLSLSASTLVDVIMETGASVKRAGFSKLVMLNSHGGQIAALAVAARRLRIEHGLLAVVHNGFASWPVQDHWPASECRFGIHAGGIETSMLLHLNPELVKLEEARDFRSNAESLADSEDSDILFPHNPDTSFGWMTQDLHESGALGNALDADETRGRIVVEAAANRFSQLLVEVACADATKLLRDRPTATTADRT